MPLELQCGNCGATFLADRDDTAVHVYHDDTYNHVRTKCELCNMPFVLFFDDKRFLQLGYEIEFHEDVDDDITNIRAQLDGDVVPELRDDPEAIMDAIVEQQFHDWLEHTNPSDFER